VLEDFLWQSHDLLGRLEEMREDLNANDFADDVSSAKIAVEAHLEMRRRILKVPVENIDNVGQRLLTRLSASDSNSDSGYSGRDSVCSSMAYNPDLQAAIPQIMHFLDQMHSGQQHLLHLWQIKKTKLEQCLQLRVFEQDCEKVLKA
jgi:triple functional domain protein